MALTETCLRCGGQGGCQGSDFGDYGWHPCFFCGASGFVEEGTAEREEYTRKVTAELYRPEYRESEGCACDDGGSDGIKSECDWSYKEYNDYLNEQVPF